MSRPIEEGCLAIVVDGAGIKWNGKSSNVGKILQVGKFVGTHPWFRYTDLWEVNQPIKCSTGEIVYVQREAFMQRIDEDDTETTTATTDVPDETTA